MTRVLKPNGFVVEHRRSRKRAVPPPARPPMTVKGSMEKTPTATQRERTVHNIESENLAKELKRRAAAPWRTKA